MEVAYRGGGRGVEGGGAGPAASTCRVCKRHRDLSRAQSQAVRRMHAVLCDLAPAGSATLNGPIYASPLTFCRTGSSSATGASTRTCPTSSAAAPPGSNAGIKLRSRPLAWLRRSKSCSPKRSVQALHTRAHKAWPDFRNIRLRDGPGSTCCPTAVVQVRVETPTSRIAATALRSLMRLGAGQESA